uniref:Uncharacterized protein n=1 Tax=Tetradesmus obliquus TaxID=3088 RepID=A0A383W6I3_TETOB|eukprot:jgi/Sobl393_1/10593/SZX72296.1
MAPSLVVLALLGLFAGAEACLQVYGTVAEGHAKSGVHFTHAYNGLDWPGSFEACRGAKQSPILLPATGAAGKMMPAAAAKSSFSYGSLSNPTIINNGHTLQVPLPDDFKSDVTIPIRGQRQAPTLRHFCSSEASLLVRYGAGLRCGYVSIAQSSFVAMALTQASTPATMK